MRKRVLSGMQPSGKMHLGNLFGALENWKRLQDEYECYFFVADWHALSTNYADTRMIRDYVREMVLDWLSAGLDPEKSTLFIQSKVHEHAVLHVLLSMITPVSWLERNPTYKEKREEITDRDLSMYGFLGYPVLQAADILIYKPAVVPVGIDQLPHLELTREIARRFNSLYEPVLPEPQALLTETPKVAGLDGRKMSKSYNNAIYLSDSPETVTDKVRNMVTDPQRARRTDPGRPEVCPVFALHKLYTSKEKVEEIDRECRTAGIGCVDCKKILIVGMLEQMKPFRDRREQVLRDPKVVDEVMEAGSIRAKGFAAETLGEVERALRLR
ncbi:MAG: tryptophan--tRNA ligase [Nitrospirae bacterium]|nr:tryptophan--tRNA ligase [Nitrospirota bacterium]